MKKCIILLITNNKKVSPVEHPFNIFWVLWLVVSYIYCTLFFNYCDYFTLELWAPMFMLWAASLIPKFNDRSFIQQYLGNNKYKIMSGYLFLNIIIIIIELIASIMFVLRNNCYDNEFLFGQMAFIIFWIGSLPMAFIKQMKFWILYGISLFVIMTILVRMVSFVAEGIF